MADQMWLRPEVVRSLSGREKWCLQVMSEDDVTIRLRKEIVSWLGMELTNDEHDVKVVIRQVADEAIEEEGYRIRGGIPAVIEAKSSSGLLYGFYAYLRALLTCGEIKDEVSAPSQHIRMIDHWDQIDGSVERGYAGESIFFGHLDSNDHSDFRQFPDRDTTNPFRGDWGRLCSYARFMASIGINAICLNNVNVRGAAARLILPPFLDRVSDIAALFHEFGIKTFLSINFASPRILGGLPTSDPLDEDVCAWWESIADNIYERIPYFGGFVVKADSEGEPGPMQYGRTHADGANMLGRAVGRHGGAVIWRAFVYDSRQDWRDRRTDRARAAFDSFRGLDGKFADNVILQVKFGPMDFQTREPLNPLIGGLRNTNLIVEYEITAEYLGQQIDVNYALPQWLEMANTVVRPDESSETVASIVKTDSRISSFSGFAAVSNVGMDDNWTGHALAQANLYGFGRMCWDGTLSSDDILQEWLRLTFPYADDEVLRTIRQIMSTSNETYEWYTAPLGVGFMVVPGLHYGPSVDGYEYDRWGTYHFADRDGIGVDRTQRTGSGYAGQYPSAVAQRYEHLDSCPDELLLFFHHVPYGHRLHNGSTVIQHIYDTHFAGYERVCAYVDLWMSLSGRLDECTYRNVLDRLLRQRENASSWRDQVNTFFYRMSGIGDERGRTIHP